MDNTATVLKAVVATIWLLGVAHLTPATTNNECKLNKLPETKDQGTLYAFEDKKLKAWIRTVGTAVLNLSVGNAGGQSETIGNSSDIRLDKWNQIVIEQITGDDGYTYSVSILDNTKWNSSKKQFPRNYVFPSSPGSKIRWSTCPPDDLMDFVGQQSSPTSEPSSSTTLAAQTPASSTPSSCTPPSAESCSDKEFGSNAMFLALGCGSMALVIAFLACVYAIVIRRKYLRLLSERGKIDREGKLGPGDENFYDEWDNNYKSQAGNLGNCQLRQSSSDAVADPTIRPGSSCSIAISIYGEL
ncbi:uncharacterized protein LOC121878060 [Homarus americanus]|nr:uncharacterized protein LOC121878060 [Homarus americanus]